MTEEALYIKPKTIKQALESADSGPKFKFISGGTDVVANQFHGYDKATLIIDVSAIEEMNTVEKRNGYLKIGSLVKLNALIHHKDIKNNFPTLIEAANSVGSPLIRATATLGGNILCENRCLYYNQSEWWRDSIGNCLKCDGDVCIATGGKKACFSELVSDTCPSLISMGAIVEIQDKQGVIQIKLEDLYTGDGVQPRNLPEKALLISIMLPLKKGFEVVFRKLRQRRSLEFTSLTSSVSKDNEGNITIALAGVDPGPVIVRGHVKDDLEPLLDKAVKKSRAIDNDMMTRKYRKQMIRTYLTESFKILEL